MIEKKLVELGLSSGFDAKIAAKLAKAWGGNEEARGDLNFFLERIREYQVDMTSSGLLLLRDGARPIRRNHMKSMLRGDYIRAGRKLKGKDIEHAIEYFLETHLAFFRKKLEDGAVNFRRVDNVGPVFSNECEQF